MALLPKLVNEQVERRQANYFYAAWELPHHNRVLINGLEGSLPMAFQILQESEKSVLSVTVYQIAGRE